MRNSFGVVLTCVAVLLWTLVILMVAGAIQSSRLPQYHISDSRIADLVITMDDGEVAWVHRGDIHIDTDFVLRLEKYAVVYQHAEYKPPTAQTYYYSTSYVYTSPHARIMRLGDVWCIDTATMPADMKPDIWMDWANTVRARECPGSAFTWGVMP